MQLNSLTKAFLLTCLLVICFAVALEYYWRDRGFGTTQNDDKVLWTSKRKELDRFPENATVFIGGSRIKFDLDIPTWENLTGGKVIQLAMVGTPARPVLHHLANESDFKGNLIIDVTEGQFFTMDSSHREKSAIESLAYYKGETPAQKASASINYALESNLVFLEEGLFSLGALLNDDVVPHRPGVFTFPVFPKEFASTWENRQTFMTEKFLNDTSLQNKQTNIWKMIMIGGMKRFPAMKDPETGILLAQFKKSIDKIRARGGNVLFVRPPSSGPLWETESEVYTREKYWDRILKETNTPGIHFADYPEIAHFVCPEMSHLGGKDVVTYTEHLVRILQTEKGWTFPLATTPLSKN
jgi:hypothetical protein